MREKAIGIFDSGIGGLTVLKEIRKQLPKEDIIYLGDTKNFPYGGKTKEQIIQFSIQNAKELLKQEIKVLVIACGTATSQALEILQQKYSIPIIGIIKPTVDFVNGQKINKIGILATEGSVRSRAWEIQLKQKNPNLQVVSKACPMLAEMAEEGKAKSREGKEILKSYLKPFQEKEIQHLILGCTHYPIYEEIIQEEYGKPVTLINTGYSVARQLQEILKQQELEKEQKKGEEIIYLTKPSKQFQKMANDIFHFSTVIKEMKMS